MGNQIVTAPSEPDGAPRISVLDILRGIAILGILFMNVNDMGASFRGGDDIRHFGWTPIDQVTWWVREVFADGTARCMLEMLFGAGMVILTDRIADGVSGWKVMQRYYVRNVVLVLLGLVHMFVFLWPGDILHSYGMAALVAFWFRKLRPRWLITIGLIMATAQFCLAGYFAIYRPLDQQRQIAAITAKAHCGQQLTAAEKKTVATAAKNKAKHAKQIAEEKAEVVKEDQDRSSTTARWVYEQIAMDVDRLGFGELFAVWESASLMLIGAALFMLGTVQGHRARGFYLRMMAIAYGVGITLRTFGAYEETRFDDAPHFSWATGEFARQAMTLGHVALVNWLLLGTFGMKLLHPFIAAGRAALTIYVLQTIACLWILYPPFGFALYGTQGWAALMLTAVIVNAALLILANWYMERYRIAPVEWAWRSLVEWRPLPIRRGGITGEPAIA